MQDGAPEAVCCCSSIRLCNYNPHYAAHTMVLSSVLLDASGTRQISFIFSSHEYANEVSSTIL